MSESEPVPEQDDQNERLRESAGEAWNAAAKAFYAFVLVLVILLGRAIQALFVLARPALMVGTVILALYGSVQLFTAAHTAFGSDAPAMLIAALSVIIVPASLIALAENYGIWAILASSGTLAWLAAFAIARSPPAVLSASIPVAIGAVFTKFAFTNTRESEEKMGIGDILLLLVNGGAIIYSAARSYHVISSTLPPEMQIVGLIALAVTEVALVGWEFYYLTSAKCARQKGIALLMFFAQLVCVFALVAGDTWMVVDPEAAPATITMAVLWAVPVILVVNMGALFGVHALNPAAKIAQAQRDVQFEIDEQAAEQLRQSKSQIAAQVSGEGARHYANETKAQYLRSFSSNGKGATATYQKDAPNEPHTESLASRLAEVVETDESGDLSEATKQLFRRMAAIMVDAVEPETSPGKASRPRSRAS